MNERIKSNSIFTKNLISSCTVYVLFSHHIFRSDIPHIVWWRAFSGMIWGFGQNCFIIECMLTSYQFSVRNSQCPFDHMIGWFITIRHSIQLFRSDCIVLIRFSTDHNEPVVQQTIYYYNFFNIQCSLTDSLFLSLKKLSFKYKTQLRAKNCFYGFWDKPIWDHSCLPLASHLFPVRKVY